MGRPSIEIKIFEEPNSVVFISSGKAVVFWEKSNILAGYDYVPTPQVLENLGLKKLEEFFKLSLPRFSEKVRKVPSEDRVKAALRKLKRSV